MILLTKRSKPIRGTEPNNSRVACNNNHRKQKPMNIIEELERLDNNGCVVIYNHKTNELATHIPHEGPGVLSLDDYCVSDVQMFEDEKIWTFEQADLQQAVEVVFTNNKFKGFKVRFPSQVIRLMNIYH